MGVEATIEAVPSPLTTSQGGAGDDGEILLEDGTPRLLEDGTELLLG